MQNVKLLSLYSRQRRNIDGRAMENGGKLSLLVLFSTGGAWGCGRKKAARSHGTTLHGILTSQSRRGVRDDAM